MSVEGIFKGITRAKKEGNSIEGTGGQKRGQTRNCNLPEGGGSLCWRLGRALDQGTQIQDEP